ncbi:unnamed protein product [Spirodela intermedia]|uniref:Uncharacterized protein n=1 Tax=Spirodela intermedia TaxID=51605 RepID=A0A7I8ISL4_SPIIN|nr:unnamed protein product [Spirodela intermedia]CAA6660859.1 unnamed protein product [Spirodela intermedia]
MAGKYIVGSIVGSFVVTYACDDLVSDRKIFGDQGRPRQLFWTRGGGEATDQKFQAWPRTAGPPVVMNPISRQNFILKTGAESQGDRRASLED